MRAHELNTSHSGGDGFNVTDAQLDKAEQDRAQDLRRQSRKDTNTDEKQPKK